VTPPIEVSVIPVQTEKLIFIFYFRHSFSAAVLISEIATLIQ